MILSLIQRRLTDRQPVAAKITLYRILGYPSLRLIFACIIRHQCVTVHSVGIFTVPHNLRILVQVFGSKQFRIRISYPEQLRIHHRLRSLDGTVQQLPDFLPVYRLRRRSDRRPMVFQPGSMIQQVTRHVRPHHIAVYLQTTVLGTHILHRKQIILKDFLCHERIRRTVLVQLAGVFLGADYLIDIRHTAINLGERTVSHGPEKTCNSHPMILHLFRKIHFRYLLNHHIRLVNPVIILLPHRSRGIDVRNCRSREIQFPSGKIQEIIRKIIPRKETAESTVILGISREKTGIKILCIRTQRRFRLPVSRVSLFVQRLSGQKIFTARQAGSQRAKTQYHSYFHKFHMFKIINSVVHQTKRFSGKDSSVRNYAGPNGFPPYVFRFPGQSPASRHRR